MSTKASTINLFGLSITTHSLSEIIERIAGTERLLKIYTPNPEQIVQAAELTQFQKVLAAGDILLPDGIGLIWASRWLMWRGRTDAALSSRVTGRALAAALLEESERRDWKVLLVGGRGYTEYAESLAARLSFRWTPGYEDVTRPTSQEEQALTELIEAYQPDLVLVAFGAPQQEFWIDRMAPTLDTLGVRAAICVGGSFDVLSGALATPPAIVSQLGLEWLFRLVQEPWRWRRQGRLVRFVRRTIASSA